MAVEGKIPASGEIKFSDVRNYLGEVEPNLPFVPDPIINSLYQKHLKRDAEESGAFYWHTGLLAGLFTIDDIENFIASSPEAQIVTDTGLPAVTLGPINDYNMNRDMFRVITKTNENTPIKASDLRTKDNSYKLFTPPYLATTGPRVRVLSPLSPKLFLKDYFDGDRFTKGSDVALPDMVKVSTYSHATEPDGMSFVNPILDVVNFYFKLDQDWASGFINQNGGFRKSGHVQLFYNASDMSVQVQALYSYDSSDSKWVKASIVRIEYIPHFIWTNFHQFYDGTYADFITKFD